MLRRLFAAIAVACLLAACQTSQTSSAGWGQIAAGVGAVVGETRIDPQVARISARLAERCAEVQTAAFAVDLLAPEALRNAAVKARVVLASVCAAPPQNVAEALVALANAYAAIEAAQRR